MRSTNRSGRRRGSLAGLAAPHVTYSGLVRLQRCDMIKHPTQAILRDHFPFKLNVTWRIVSGKITNQIWRLVAL
jgi:hypothetical protein